MDTEAQVAAARDLLADGLSRSAVVDSLRAMFGLSPATAYRRVAAALDAMDQGSDAGDSGAVSVDIASESLGCMLRLMQRAEDAGDEDEAMKRAKALAAAAARLRILRLQL